RHGTQGRTQNRCGGGACGNRPGARVNVNRRKRPDRWIGNEIVKAAVIEPCAEDEAGFQSLNLRPARRTPTVASGVPIGAHHGASPSREGIPFPWTWVSDSKTNQTDGKVPAAPGAQCQRRLSPGTLQIHQRVLGVGSSSANGTGCYTAAILARRAWIVLENIPLRVSASEQRFAF